MESGVLQVLITFRVLWLALAIAPALVFAGSKTNGQCTLVLPVSKTATDVLSTGRIRTTSTAVQPLDDTFCIADPEHTLICQGVDKPARIRIPGKDGDTLNVSATGSVCSARPSKTSTPSWKEDVMVTGESITGMEGLMLPDIPAITAWEIHCRDLVKKEPPDTPLTEADDQGSDSQVQVVDVAFVSKSRGQHNTTCGCGKHFDTVSLLKSHRNSSSESLCKGRKNTICGCGKNFNTVNQFYAHRYSSSDSLCKGRKNTSCGCGKNFNTACQLMSHRYSSSENLCKGDLNTSCGCGKNFDTIAQLLTHRKSSSDSLCKGDWNTTCGCGKNFDTVNRLAGHRKSSSASLCNGGWNTSCGCGKSFVTVNQFFAHRKSSNDTRCKSKRSKKKGGVNS